MEFDPYVLLTSLVVSTVAGAATWLWGKISGTKAADVAAYLRNLIEPHIEHEIAEAIDQKLSAIATRYKIEDAAWGVLERVGVKRSTVATRVVNELVERAVGEFRRRLRELANERAAAELPKELARLEQATKDAAAAFEPPPPDKRTVPELGLEIELVK